MRIIEEPVVACWNVKRKSINEWILTSVQFSYPLLMLRFSIGKHSNSELFHGFSKEFLEFIYPIHISLIL